MRRNLQRDAIIRELDRHGVSWFESAGGKHERIIVDVPGRPYLVYSRGSNQKDGRIAYNVRAQVRRVLRDHGSLNNDRT
jgi:hypothetical protein